MDAPGQDPLPGLDLLLPGSLRARRVARLERELAEALKDERIGDALDDEDSIWIDFSYGPDGPNSVTVKTGAELEEEWNSPPTP